MPRVASAIEFGARFGVNARALRRSLPCVLAVVLASALGGCAAGVPGTVATTPVQAGSIAFESVDGPPPQVFDRLVRNIETEARGRNLTVVGREAPAAYRVRSYLSAQVRQNRTSIAWVWDVYDANQQRALRLSGSESAGKLGTDAWADADEQVLRRIAQAGIGGLADLVNGGRPAPSAPPAPSPIPSSGPAVADASAVTPADGRALGFAAY